MGFLKPKKPALPSTPTTADAQSPASFGSARNFALPGVFTSPSGLTTKSPTVPKRSLIGGGGST